MTFSGIAVSFCGVGIKSNQKAAVGSFLDTSEVFCFVTAAKKILSLVLADWANIVSLGFTSATSSFTKFGQSLLYLIKKSCSPSTLKFLWILRSLTN